MTVRPAARSLALVAAAVVYAGFAACAARSADDPPPATTTTGQPMVKGGTAGPGAAAGADPVARGKFLAEVLGCIECHTPRGADGKPDARYFMAGHRADDPYPTWSDSLWDREMGMIVSTTGTAYAGPWGITFARNLTPDPTTGIGGWNEEAFVYILREGTLKPPMPNLLYGNLSDDDLKSIFAWLRSLPPVKNLVPFRQLSPPRLPGETPGTKGKGK
jgi:mono/diheme cytochrome c family protein